MFHSLDTLISFIVIMTVTSLFVTILVQMFSAALSLRGKNLANALALTFQTVDPNLGEQAHMLAARILSDPLLSDSTRTDKTKNAASKSASREGPWHFTDVFGATRLASAVRPEEVYAALERLAAAPLAAADAGAAQSRTTKSANKKTRRAGPSQAAIVQAAKSILDSLQRNRVTMDAPVKRKLIASEEDSGGGLGGKVDHARAVFDAWFGSAQDRAQQWFQLHIRGLTIAASALIALVLQLDAVEVFRHVSINAASRHALVGTADQVIKEANGSLDEKGGLLKRVADAWALRRGQPPVDLSGVTHNGQLQERLRQQDATFNAREFEEVVAVTTTAYYNDQRARLRELTRGVGATGFEFIPVNYWRWPSPAGTQESLRNVMSHLPGIALFTALLTLGAPYWYNILKNLTSLRPALAQLIGKEEAVQTETGK